MRYSRIDLTGTSIVNFSNHEESMEVLANWKKGIQLSERIIKPIKQEDGVIEYKFSESAYRFLLPETHPLYNSIVLFNTFNYPANGKSQIQTRNAIIEHLRQLRH